MKHSPKYPSITRMRFLEGPFNGLESILSQPVSDPVETMTIQLDTRAAEDAVPHMTVQAVYKFQYQVDQVGIYRFVSAPLNN